MGGSDVGRFHYLHHAGSGDTKHITQFNERQGQDRQDKHVRSFPWGLLTDDRCAWNQTQPHGHDEDEEYTGGKLRGHGKHHAPNGKHAVPNAPLFQSGEHAEEQGQGHDNHESGPGQNQRVTEPQKDTFGDRAARSEGKAGISADKSLFQGDVLHGAARTLHPAGSHDKSPDLDIRPFLPPDHVVLIVHAPEVAPSGLLLGPLFIVFVPGFHAQGAEFGYSKQVLAFKFPSHQGAVTPNSPPLLETIFRGDAFEGHTHLFGGRPVAAEEPVQIAHIKGLIQTHLG